MNSLQEYNIIYENGNGKKLYKSIKNALKKYIDIDFLTGSDGCEYHDANEEDTKSETRNFVVRTADGDEISGFAYRTDSDENSIGDRCWIVMDFKRGYDPEETYELKTKIANIVFSGKYPDWAVEG